MIVVFSFRFVASACLSDAEIDTTSTAGCPFGVRKRSFRWLFCATLMLMFTRMPVVSRTETTTVRTGSASAARPVSMTPGLFGTTSKLFALTIAGTGSIPGSLEVIA